MARAGIDSRRNCEQLIVEGAVRVNRKVVETLPVFVDPDRDIITVDGRKIRPEQKVYYLLNKPKGVICTNSDPQGRKKAIDLVPSKNRIFCVGRLDAETTGAIILTNDSELANRLTHPRYKLSKTYEIRVVGEITGQAVEKIKKGVWLAEGKTGKAAVKILKRGHRESLVEVTIRKGLNRQLRRMMAKIGYKVKGLKRTKIGNLTLHNIGAGRYKELAASQLAYLRRVTAEKTEKTSKK